jgi:hypothetical protein
MSRSTYIRPDVVYRTGSVRPFSYGGNPVQEAYDIARDFTRDPGVVGGQFVRAANDPNIEFVRHDSPTQARRSIVPAFIRRFFGGR